MQLVRRLGALLVATGIVVIIGWAISVSPILGLGLAAVIGGVALLVVDVE